MYVVVLVALQRSMQASGSSQLFSGKRHSSSGPPHQSYVQGFPSEQDLSMYRHLPVAESHESNVQLSKSEQYFGVCVPGICQ